MSNLMDRFKMAVIKHQPTTTVFKLGIENLSTKKGSEKIVKNNSKSTKIAPFNTDTKPSKIPSKYTSDINGNKSRLRKKDINSKYVVSGPTSKSQPPLHVTAEKHQLNLLSKPVVLNITGTGDATPTSEHRTNDATYDSSPILNEKSCNASKVSFSDQPRRSSMQISQMITNRLSALIFTLPDNFPWLSTSKSQNTSSRSSTKTKTQQTQDRFDFADLKERERIVKGVYGSYLVLEMAMDKDIQVADIESQTYVNEYKR